MTRVPFVNTEDTAVAAVLANADSDTVAAGPYIVVGGRWTYEATEVDKRFGDDHSISGQFNLVVRDATGFCKVLIPADEGDGHSGGEAVHALLALNSYDAMLEALKKCVAAYEEHRDQQPTGHLWPDPNHIFHARAAIAKASGQEDGL